ncbi:MAG: hypothetical protein ACK55I_24300, partial [bacterium]
GRDIVGRDHVRSGSPVEEQHPITPPHACQTRRRSRLHVTHVQRTLGLAQHLLPSHGDAKAQRLAIAIQAVEALGGLKTRPAVPRPDNPSRLTGNRVAAGVAQSLEIALDRRGRAQGRARGPLTPEIALGECREQLLLLLLHGATGCSHGVRRRRPDDGI